MRMPNEEAIKLIKDIISKHDRTLLPIVESIGKSPLTLDERESLREVISDEFIATGLDENYEPNGRGYMLEGLIDILGHL